MNIIYSIGSYLKQNAKDNIHELLPFINFEEVLENLSVGQQQLLAKGSTKGEITARTKMIKLAKSAEALAKDRQKLYAIVLIEKNAYLKSEASLVQMQTKINTATKDELKLMVNELNNKILLLKSFESKWNALKANMNREIVLRQSALDESVRLTSVYPDHASLYIPYSQEYTQILYLTNDYLSKYTKEIAINFAQKQEILNNIINLIQNKINTNATPVPSPGLYIPSINQPAPPYQGAGTPYTNPTILPYQGAGMPYTNPTISQRPMIIN